MREENENSETGDRKDNESPPSPYRIQHLRNSFLFRPRPRGYWAGGGFDDYFCEMCGIRIPEGEALHFAYRRITGWGRGLWTGGHDLIGVRYQQPFTLSHEACIFSLPSHMRLSYDDLWALTKAERDAVLEGMTEFVRKGR